MSITKRNESMKAMQSKMSSEKKNDPNIKLEWEIACNTNNKRGHVYDQSELMDLYSRDGWEHEHGASKTVHIKSHLDEDFQYIVIKRHKTHGYIDEHAYNPDTKQTGNQLIDEINCWLEYQDKKESDMLCPILKYFTSKSDKVSAISEKMQCNVIIIAQKAVYVNDCATACSKAERMNERYNLNGETAENRYEKMKAFSRQQKWRDALHNGGNCGVIYDYSKNCYKAVFIDYAL